MKNLLAFLGCGLLAFAIGCSDSPKPTAPSTPPDPAMMKEMMKANGANIAPTADGTAAADAAAADAAAADAKKEEEKKEEAKPEEKKEEEKKEDK